MTTATASASLAVALLFASLLAGTVFGDDIIPIIRMPLLERFHAWQAEYNRTYATPEEFQYRFRVYCENVKFIETMNRPGSSYELGENQFTDLTQEEFEDMYLMKLNEVASAPEAMGQLGTMNAGGTSGGGNTDEAPNYVDWRTKEAVTPCRRDKLGHHAATIRGGWAVQRNNEAMLERAVARQPVTVLINASRAFKSYKRGVFSGPCNTSLNHAVTVVGYGADTGGRKYWIVKNSWGQTWGENGYVRLERRVSSSKGMCGIAMAPYYPVM
ncbi:hypothetical protein SETIT_7G060000v2 [Setaria italica]|uniref:Cathepsin propeptide inhibitor domain-containing protein n=1 Tax=Setaria italica TaxID=4555 RepID=A0A368RSD4_SETIT|nr:hypothetical protein SETIT_7G060000v2 [Setaria italica]